MVETEGEGGRTEGEWTRDGAGGGEGKWDQQIGMHESHSLSIYNLSQIIHLLFLRCFISHCRR